MQLMKSMAQELAHANIRVNGIAPGRQDRDQPPRPEYSGRVGVPNDIARVAVWLASDQADYIHGETIFVDGGMTLYPGFAEGG